MFLRDLTPQEDLVAKCLDELGIRYSQQIDIGQYTIDFLVEDTIILEADGFYGHFNKYDRAREEDLLRYGDGRFEKIVRIIGDTEEAIREELQYKLLLCRE